MAETAVNGTRPPIYHLHGVNMITQEYLKSVLEYCPDTGVFTWKGKKGTKCKSGERAGNINKVTGYLKIQIDGARYLGHRLAFLYMTGSFPPDQVDHIDHDRSNNRWNNLRAVSSRENDRNRSISPRNTSGASGVSWHKGKRKWHGRICNIHLGYFDSFDAAVEARKAACASHGFHENHGTA